LATGMLGLLFSALVTSQEQTMPVLAVSVILQLLLCGGLIDITGRQPIDALSHLVPGRWAFGLGANTVDLKALNPRTCCIQGVHATPRVSLAGVGCL